MKLDPAWIAAAQAAQAKWRIPASVTLAQFGQESGFGKHMPEGSNNPFGVKAHPGERSVMALTREFVAGRYVSIKAPFRAYASLAEAFDDHARLLAQAQPYAKARRWLALGPPKWNVLGFVHDLTGVYATDPEYAEHLTAIIEGDNLTQYDCVP